MFWLLIKTLFTIIPMLLDAIKAGKIKSAAQDEIMTALVDQFDKRVHDAIRAGIGPLIDEDDDPFNRARAARNQLRLDLEQGHDL